MLEPKDNPLLFWAGEQFLSVCPLSIKPLMDAVRALPGLEDWAPTGSTHVHRLLMLGMILRRIDDASFRPLVEKIAESLRQDNEIPRDHEAELIAAAVIRPWCSRVTYIPRSGEQRRPDLVASGPKGDIEIEVTTAQRKSEQQERNMFASQLQARLCEIPLERRIDVHFIDTLSTDEVQSVIEAATALEIGNTAEVQDRWHVRVSAPMGGVVIVGNAPPPAWFPEQPATPASFSGTFSVGEQKAPTATAQVRWGLSTKSYLNPLSKKAERHQGSSKVPFLIAMDETQLPGAAGWFKEALAGYWEL